MLFFPGSHCAFKPSTAFASSFVSTSCSSSFPRPGNFARNVPRSNPGSTAMSTFSNESTCGIMQICTFDICSKCASSSIKALIESWFGVPRIIQTSLETFESSAIIFLTCKTSLWLLACQTSARSSRSPQIKE